MARRLLPLLAVALFSGCALTPQDVGRNIVLPEQRSIDYHDPALFPPAPIPDNIPPRTVTAPRPDTPIWQLSLDEALRIALENARVIRVLTGTTAVSSGQTIYDAAITNTTIDQAQAVFDPTVSGKSTWSRTNTPFGEFISPGGSALASENITQGTVAPGAAAGGLVSAIASTPTDSYLSDVGVTKTNVLGGKWGLDWTENPVRIAQPGPFPLNPETPSTLALSYTQPLLQGAGFLVNTAPIAIARLNTEQSYFMYKDSVQEMVRGVIEAYWDLVQARTDLWAKGIQVRQSKEAFDREDARLKTGFGDAGTLAQARVTYHQFVANRIAAEANVLTLEGALRNILGLPPSDNRNIVPTSAPTSRRLPYDWDALLRLAEQRRPDIAQLKLVAEADKLRLVQAQNQALPQLNAVASYQFNGLEGLAPNGETLATAPGQYTSWTVGLNFSVPLGLRQGRALVRQQELVLARDRANVDQALHAAVHELATTVRDLDSAYEQYLAFKETREAADINLRVQLEQFKVGRTIYLNVLQALNDWGNSVSAEAQQLLNYNIALATLERRTGTILETHGLIFTEERSRATGPLVLPRFDRLYPTALIPVGAPLRYGGTGAPSENTFDLTNPVQRDSKPPEELPRPRLGLPVQ